MWVFDRVIFCPVVWSIPLAPALVSHYLTFHVSIESPVSGSRARPLHWDTGTVCLPSVLFHCYAGLCQISKTIGSTHTWNTLPILWIERTYNTSVHKYYSGDKQRESKRHALNPVSEGLHNLRWGAARRCLTSHVSSLFEQDAQIQRFLIIKMLEMIGIIQKLHL